jgi:hypothetical protein
MTYDDDDCSVIASLIALSLRVQRSNLHDRNSQDNCRLSTNIVEIASYLAMTYDDDCRVIASLIAPSLRVQRSNLHHRNSQDNCRLSANIVEIASYLAMTYDDDDCSVIASQ